MSTALKWLLSVVLFVCSFLLMRISGWFGMGVLVGLLLSILYGVDLGREFSRERILTSGTRTARVLTAAPLTLYASACAILGVGVICVVVYSAIFERGSSTIGALLALLGGGLAFGCLMALYGVGILIDVFGGTKAVEAMAAKLQRRSESNDATAGIEPWRFGTWEILSFAWTEIGIEQRECEELVRKYGIDASNLPDAMRVGYRDVCGSFAFETFLLVPLMLWMFMPDWGYDEAWLKRKAERWYAKPWFMHFLNPIRLVGYPVALLFAMKYFRMLRRAVRSST